MDKPRHKLAAVLVRLISSKLLFLGWSGGVSANLVGKDRVVITLGPLRKESEEVSDRD